MINFIKDKGRFKIFINLNCKYEKRKKNETFQSQT